MGESIPFGLGICLELNQHKRTVFCFVSIRNVGPIPRDYGMRNRLYSTVMNKERTDKEKKALGADIAGVEQHSLCVYDLDRVQGGAADNAAWMILGFIPSQG